MISRMFALVAILLTAAKAEAQSSTADTTSTHKADGWIAAVSLGIPGYRSEASVDWLTVGANFTQVHVGRPGADLSFGTIPRLIAEGALPLGVRAGVALPLAPAPRLLLIPSGGLSLVAATAGGEAGGVFGWNAGVSAVAHQGRVGLRTGITWHSFPRAEGSIWLLEIGVVSVPAGLR